MERYDEEVDQGWWEGYKEEEKKEGEKRPIQR